jgi:aryl-alcohol dehydrogenase-like predicted oxidoreductase
LVIHQRGVVLTGSQLSDRRLDGRPTHLKQAAQDSCRRPGLSHLDLYYLHWPAPDVPFTDQVGALKDLRDAGVIRHIGLSNVSVEQFTAASEIAPIAAVTQRFNLLEQSSDELLALTRDTDVVFSPWFPTGQFAGIGSAASANSAAATPNMARLISPAIPRPPTQSHLL